MVSSVLMRFIQLNKGVHLQYFEKHVSWEKLQSESCKKKIILQQCCVQQQYTKERKLLKLQVQCMTKMKQEKPVFFSNEALLTYV